ncbi:MAG TPA: hypothetical protein QF873_02590 [Patescibacteria group bacterium]|nr:hypothetical protein [Patescibacteria group bacterium]
MNRENLFSDLLQTFDMTPDSYNKYEKFYNSDFSAYGNEVYADIQTRLVHLRNFWNEDNWFNQRLRPLFDLYQNYDQIIDYGYSLPYLHLYLADRDELNRAPECIYIDSERSSETVTKAILYHLDTTAHIVIGDIQIPDVFEEISKITQRNTKRLHVALETIEHLTEPEAFWKQLQRFIGDDILISLPIGPKIPSHELVFEDTKQIEAYLSPYIKTIHSYQYAPNTKSVKNIDEFSLVVTYGIIKEL